MKIPPLLQNIYSRLLSLLVATGLLSSCSKVRNVQWTTPEEYYALPRWSERVAEFKQIKRPSHTCSLFIGDSITEGFNLEYFFGDSTMVNMGIGGDFTEGLLRRLEPVVALQPRKIFVLIGINDVLKRLPLETISANHLQIIKTLRDQCPQAQIYFQELMPINHSYRVQGPDGRVPTRQVIKEIVELNRRLEHYCTNEKISFIPLCTAFANDNGLLRNELTYDGLHLDNNGNQVWTTLLRDLNP